MVDGQRACGDGAETSSSSSWSLLGGREHKREIRRPDRQACAQSRKGVKEFGSEKAKPLAFGESRRESGGGSILPKRHSQGVLEGKVGLMPNENLLVARDPLASPSPLPSEPSTSKGERLGTG